MKKLTIIAILLFLSVSFSSCINIVRNIKVNKDGSGSENATFVFDKMFFDVMTAFATMTDSSRITEVKDSLYNDADFISNFKQKLSGADGITLKEIYSETNLDSSKTLFFSYDFNSIDLLGVALSDDNDEVMGGEVIAKFIDDGNNVRFSYSQKNNSPEDADSTYDNIMTGIAETFRGQETIYNIEFPYEIVSSNANMQDGRLLTWIIYMEDFIANKRDLYLEVVMKK